MYGYQENGWKDQLIAIDDMPVTYDDAGNPLTYKNMLFTWQHGSELATVEKEDGTALAFTYDDSGIRTAKTVNGEVTRYYTDGTKLLAELGEDYRLDFFYDENGEVIGFLFNNEDTYF